jgi:hypothetical protein
MKTRSPIDEGIDYNSPRGEQQEKRTPRAPGIEPDDTHVRHHEEDPDSPRNPGDQPNQKLETRRASPGRPSKVGGSKTSKQQDPRSDRITGDQEPYRTDQEINRPRHEQGNES